MVHYLDGHCRPFSAIVSILEVSATSRVLSQPTSTNFRVRVQSKSTACHTAISYQLSFDFSSSGLVEVEKERKAMLTVHGLLQDLLRLAEYLGEVKFLALFSVRRNEIADHRVWLFQGLFPVSITCVPALKTEDNKIATTLEGR